MAHSGPQRFRLGLIYHVIRRDEPLDRLLQLVDQWLINVLRFVIALRQGAPCGALSSYSYSHFNHVMDHSQHVPTEKLERAL